MSMDYDEEMFDDEDYEEDDSDFEMDCWEDDDIWSCESVSERVSYKVNQITSHLHFLRHLSPEMKYKRTQAEVENDPGLFRCYMCGETYEFDPSRPMNQYELCCFCRNVMHYRNTEFMTYLKLWRNIMGVKDDEECNG